MFEAIRELIRLEPVRVRAVVGALIGLAISLGISIDDAQRGTILEFVDLILPLAGALLGANNARKLVTPNARLEGNG
jgi:hypothetical protein